MLVHNETNFEFIFKIMNFLRKFSKFGNHFQWNRNLINMKKIKGIKLLHEISFENSEFSKIFWTVKFVAHSRICSYHLWWTTCIFLWYQTIWHIQIFQYTPQFLQNTLEVPSTKLFELLFVIWDKKLLFKTSPDSVRTCTTKVFYLCTVPYWDYVGFKPLLLK